MILTIGRIKLLLFKHRCFIHLLSWAPQGVVIRIYQIEGLVNTSRAPLKEERKSDQAFPNFKDHENVLHFYQHFLEISPSCSHNLLVHFFGPIKKYRLMGATVVQRLRDWHRVPKIVSDRI